MTNKSFVGSLHLGSTGFLKREAVWLLIFLFLLNAENLFAQVKLEADGPGSTYELIDSKFGTGIEHPDCSHTSFGRHITETFDSQLNKNVFVFHIHADIDNDRCTNFDRQRNEIKGGSGSPADMQHTSGQTAFERWKFKLDAGFIPSGRFTHIMQIKAIDGDAGAPLMTLTPRAGSPQKMQVIHSSGSDSGGQGTIAEVDLAPFKGQWCEAFMTYKSSEGSGGSFSLVVKRISDGATLLSVSRTGIDMWRTGASYNRPKWGIYRGLDPVLRDEQVRFADFCITESSASLCPSSIGTGTAPAAPSNLIASTISSSQINLSWTDNSSNESTFRIERSTDAGATWALLTTVGANVTTFSNTGLAASTTYHYRVRAENAVGNSAFSNTANATTLAAIPNAPSNLTAIAISSSQINLSWSDNSGNETLFRIERSTDAGATWASLTTVPTNTTTFSNTGLTASTTYHYRVRAENAAGNSAFSNIANATTSAPVTIPNAPSNLTASAISSSQINLGWTDNSDNETLFRIERSTDAGATWASLTTVPTNTTTFSNTGLAASTTYHYRVRAENSAGNSAFSNTANATTNGVTLPPIGTGTTQAESLNMVGYEANLFETVNCVRAISTTLGHIKGTFTGSTGSYNITVRAFDENDGAATLTLKVNGTTIGSRTFSINDHTWKDWVLTNVAISNGSEIRIEGAHQAGEHARIDLIQVASVVSGDIYLEAESGTITSPLQVGSNAGASGGQYITVAAGNNSQTAAPATGRATYNFTIGTAGTYKVWGRSLCPTNGDDSFWVRMDGGTWINWNEMPVGTTWTWDDVHSVSASNPASTFSLSAGSHTLEFAYREDGAQLDRILITNNLSLNPNTSSSSARSASQGSEIVISGDEYPVFEGSKIIIAPNPALDQTTIYYETTEEGLVKVTLYNSVYHRSTVLVNENLPAGKHKTVVDASALPKGLHIIRVIHKENVRTSKLLKK